MYEKELQVINARSKEGKIVLGPYMQNWIEKDLPKLFAEVEILRAEREQLRGIIQSLKEECSTLSRESSEHLKEIQAALNDFRSILGSFNESESLGHLDQAFSD